MINLFILGYNGAEYFEEWFDRTQFPNTKLYYIDNGHQKLSDSLKKDCIHSTERNLGCAGGWNLICDIAFKHFNLDKAIIGNEDAMISEEILKAEFDACNPSTICGAYDGNWEFSSYCIHKDTYSLIGRFDENILFAGCEDEDYKYRCKLCGIKIANLDVSHTYNRSMANNDKSKPRESSVYNGEYVRAKWGDYKYTTPFNDNTYVHKPTKMFNKYYGEIEEWLSAVEFSKFKEKQI